MRIIFAGSPAIAVPSLERLFKMHLDGKIELAGILTNADAPKGRKGNPEPTEIALAAEALSSLKNDHPHLTANDFPLPVLFKPEKLDSAFREKIAALKPDLLVSFAYGKIFGPKFLELFPLGGINIHPSLLPKYRGPSPINAAILNRDAETGISIQKLAKEMDAGDILVQEKIILNGTETAASLSDDVSLKSTNLLEQTIENILQKDSFENASFLNGIAQDHTKALYCKLISRDDGIISWNKSALEIDAQIRAYNPWPLARTKIDDKDLYLLEAKPHFQYPDLGTAAHAKNGTVLGIDKEAGILVKTDDGILALTKLQYAGKKALDWRSFLNGARNFIGSVLGKE
jgi:methionyl-tRNA formyltransferase